MRRANFAPRGGTIAVALVLIVLGLLGTYGTWVPDEWGIAAFVAATVVLLLGMLFRGI